LEYIESIDIWILAIFYKNFWTPEPDAIEEGVESDVGHEEAEKQESLYESGYKPGEGIGGP
jgi:hypothetical protein